MLNYLKRMRSAFAQLARARTEMEALRQRASKLELVFRNSIDVLLLIDPSTGVIENASDAVESKLGYRKSAILGRSIHEILPADGDEGSSKVSRGVADGVFMDTPVTTAGGDSLPMDMTLSLVAGVGGSALLVTLRDSSERRRRQRELLTWNTALQASLSPMVITDCDWIVSCANSSAMKAWGMDQERFRETHVRDLLEDGAFNSLSQAIVELGEWQGEVGCVAADGRSFQAMASGALSCSEEGAPRCVVFSFVDISRRKELEDRLREMSLRDSLTGLYNRRGFFAVGEQILREARRRSTMIGVLFVDLDGLKEINDAYGHASGDRAIVETAELLRNCYRESDVVSRLGGDEFAVLFSEAGCSREPVIRKRLNEALSRANSGSGMEFHLKLSMGFACDAGAEAALESLLTMADNRMYLEKRARKAAREVH